jgi:hypothetical protein
MNFHAIFWPSFVFAYYLLTPWSRVLLEKLTGFAASQEIPRIYLLITVLKVSNITATFYIIHTMPVLTHNTSSNICTLSSITNKMQRYTIFFIAVDALRVRAVFPPIIRSSKFKTVHTTSGICPACLLLPPAVAASKLDIYQMLCVQFWILSSWWLAEKLPQHGEHRQQ